MRGIRAIQGVVIVLLCGLFSGCKVREAGSVETAFMTAVKRDVTVGGKKDVNPFPATEKNIHAGRLNFSNYCMVCHGSDGHKTDVPFADHMAPPVPDLSSSQVQSYTDGQLKWIIDNGIFPSGMPASKGILKDDEIWQIVVFLRHLPAQGSLGEPAEHGGAAQK